LLRELSDAGRKIIFFHQAAEAVLCRVARAFRVNLLPGAPADHLGIGDVSDRHGFVLGVGEDFTARAPLIDSGDPLPYAV